jgi:hypothetical protein
MQRFKRISILIFCFLLLTGFYSIAMGEETPHPFRPGEKMSFVLKYGMVPGGEATLEVHDMEEIQGVEAYHFVMTARTNSFVDIFFKVRDRVDSYADASMNHSLLYKKDQHEGRTKRKIKVDFDWEENKSTYERSGAEPKVADLIPRTFDPLSIFYYTRLLDLQELDELTHPVTDGRKNMMGILRVLGRETVTVPAGTYDTLVLEPNLLKVEGVFSKKPNAKIKLWVTNDERRLLVRMASKATVGSFVAELVAVEGHAPVILSQLKAEEY